MHGGCPKCGPMPKAPCGCPSAPMPMEMPMPMPMGGPMAVSMPVGKKDPQKMKDAAKRLLDKLQDLDFDKIDVFDLQVTIGGDPDAMEDLATSMEDETVDSDSSNTHMEETDDKEA